MVVSDETLGNLVAFVLFHCAFVTRICPPGTDPRLLAHVAESDLLLIDVAVEKGAAISLLDDGAVVAGRARLALMRQRGRWSSLEAFAGGADQVITVPFTPDELAVRTQALLGRLGRRTALVRGQLFGDVELSIDERIRIGDRSVTLTPSQNSLLYVLAANAGRPVAARHIREIVWGFAPESSEATIRRRVDELRSLTRDAGFAIDAEHGMFTLRPAPAAALSPHDFSS